MDINETNSAKEANTFMVPSGGVGISSVTACHMLQKAPQIVVNIGHLRWGKSKLMKSKQTYDQLCQTNCHALFPQLHPTTSLAPRNAGIP